ncbi:M3 family oligoendopeptidase [Paenibacillus caseinilyticus]|uniref:Oligoendopeptidase F n=1 Tax=Paenibacillus mucilaginosus K02 TaxID=997761 RepID=I0BMR8_9BACL|nr:M3 family oligoendopeptidase [Paenibacillus mucilaginosus]AFH63665.1 oligoendopeptidase F [Paenibacillus mucilaginosus K02]
MLQFAEYAYQRPDLQALEQEFGRHLEDFRSAGSAQEQAHALQAINGLRSGFETAANLAYIRHTMHTKDDFYKQEQDFIDEARPAFQSLVNPFYEALAASPFRRELESRFGRQLFALAETSLKTFSPEVVEDLQQENKLVSEYTQLVASAIVSFDGRELTLPELGPYLQSPDREIRRRASAAGYTFFSANEERFDEMYDKLVQVRTGLARKLGFPSFTPLAYARLGRTDYDETMVARFREGVLNAIVPLASRLKERQRSRIGVDRLYYYDESFLFPSGNAKPKGEPAWLVKQAEQMYGELSPETGAFFSFMAERGLLDLYSRPGKAAGGYCTYLPDFGSPFIYANCNGTAGDIQVLTHEAGHAYQVYCSGRLEVPEYHWPTMDAAEIHSMSMEFITYPWMELFFREDADKYRFSNLVSSLTFIPYGCAVDEYQHWIYAHPEASAGQRKAAWREIERRYLPHRDYDDNEYLERGGFWQKQGHIFHTPFYYIDYTLAQLCAFQFWQLHTERPAEAWESYNRLCKLGGSLPFTELVTDAGLGSPFDPQVVSSVIGQIQVWLDGVDDKSL